MSRVPGSLLHVSADVDRPGGMGAIIRRHRMREPQSAFIGLFDRPAGRGLGETYHLGARGWTTARQLRAAFQQAVAGSGGKAVAVYHNAWGAAWFAGLDAATRRVAFLHTDRPDFEQCVQALRRQFDGLICLSDAMRTVCLAKLPEMTPERCVVLPYPVDAPTVPPVLSRGKGQPLRLGYAGRLDQPQKRLDRVAPFLARLDAAGVDWRFDFLGDGPMRPELARQFAGDPRIVFHGWCAGPAYWEVLAQWDGIVFFSDYEASPLAQLEAMAAGVLPFFPLLGRTQGEIDAAAVDARGVYPAGDLAAAADQVRRVFAEPAATLTQLRCKAAAIAQRHHGDAYEEAFRRWIADIVRWPRLSTDRPRTSRVSDLLPVGCLARFWPHALQS